MTHIKFTGLFDTLEKDIPAKTESLKKGINQRLFPYNPREEASKFKNNQAWEWTQGHISPEKRAAFPRIDGNARERLLHKLSGLTNTRINPETGKREFLLHRGMSPEEHKKHFKDGHLDYTNLPHSFTSWTPKRDIAQYFGSSLVSAWVNEDDIHAAPFQTGLVRDGKHEKLSDRLKNEREIIVHHKSPLKEEDYNKAFELSIPFRDTSTGNTEIDIQADDGYWDKVDVSNINTKINNRNKLKKNLKLSKKDPISNKREKNHGESQKGAQMARIPGRNIWERTNFSNISSHGDGEGPKRQRMAALVQELVRGRAGQGDGGDRPSELEKAYQHKNTWRPDHSDKDGMPHPEVPHYVKGTSANNMPVWKYNDESINNQKIAFAKNYSNFRNSNKISQKGLKHLYNLGDKLLKDPDAFNVASGNEDGTQSLRLRHLSNALSGKGGYSISESNNGLTIVAPRHSGNKNNLGEVHTWHFDGKDLKFLNDKLDKTNRNFSFYNFLNTRKGSANDTSLLKKERNNNSNRGILHLGADRNHGKISDKQDADGTPSGGSRNTNRPQNNNPGQPAKGLITKDHAHPLFSDHHFDLIEGLDLDKPSSTEHMSLGITPGVGLYQHDKGHSVFIKPNMNTKLMAEAFDPEGKDFTGEIAKKYKHHNFDEFGTAHREAAFHDLATNFFGLPGEYIPKTTLYNHGDNTYSAQEFLDVIPGFSFDASSIDDEDDPASGAIDLQKMAVIDAILGNNDRHQGNYMQKRTDGKSRPVLIDHGLAFDYHENPIGNVEHPAYLRNYDDQIHHNQIMQETVDWIYNLDIEKFDQHLQRIGIPAKHKETAIDRLSDAKLILSNTDSLEDALTYIKNWRYS